MRLSGLCWGQSVSLHPRGPSLGQREPLFWLRLGIHECRAIVPLWRRGWSNQNRESLEDRVFPREQRALVLGRPLEGLLHPQSPEPNKGGSLSSITRVHDPQQ